LTAWDFFNDPLGEVKEPESDWLTAEEVLEKMNKLFPPPVN